MTPRRDPPKGRGKDRVVFMRVLGCAQAARIRVVFRLRQVTPIVVSRTPRLFNNGRITPLLQKGPIRHKKVGGKRPYFLSNMPIGYDLRSQWVLFCAEKEIDHGYDDFEKGL